MTASCVVKASTRHPKGSRQCQYIEAVIKQNDICRRDGDVIYHSLRLIILVRNGGAGSRPGSVRLVRLLSWQDLMRETMDAELAGFSFWGFLCFGCSVGVEK
ncbi:hypothetical protein Zmor_028059 [Zophobas morio]|uniref:Uncharacterized protein n=1 Tax=Zophobas morio TaxID=2755281 RepID=A0AA38M342_9CUCU|nr:hypothetical protein Zmor_028059 [Zophobas morio]